MESGFALDADTTMTQMQQGLSQSHVRLALAMQTAQLSPTELVQHVSLSRKFMNRLLRGDVDLANVKGRTLLELSLVLNVSTDFLLGKGVGAEVCRA